MLTLGHRSLLNVRFLDLAAEAPLARSTETLFMIYFTCYYRAVISLKYFRKVLILKSLVSYRLHSVCADRIPRIQLES
jgi:hypothetical protein